MYNAYYVVQKVSLVTSVTLVSLITLVTLLILVTGAMITTGSFSLLYSSIKGKFLCNINVDDDFCDIK